MTEWNIETLRAFMVHMMEEREKRYDERFEAQRTAIDKAEAAVERRFTGVNELRGALDDAAKLQMPRSESNARYDSVLAKIEDYKKQDAALYTSMNDRLNALSRRMDLREGEQLGSKDTKGDSRATWAIIIAVASVVTQLVISYVR